jgi:phosphatidate cytidylyltransferase
MLRWRLLLGTAIIGLLVGLCWLDDGAAVPGVWLLPVAIAFAVGASGEILRLARAAGLRPIAWTVYLGNVLLVLSPWLPLVCLGGQLLPEPGHPAAEYYRLASQAASWALAAGVVLVFLAEMGRYERPGGIIANVAAAVFSLVYVGSMLAFAVQFRMHWGIGAVAAWVITVKMGDTGAYTVGRLVGRHKLAPVLSPGKTVEGAVGALVFACLASWASFHWLVPLTRIPCGAAPASPWGWLVFGLLMGGFGMVGDLAESLLKRDAGCKDSSSWMPGFGGVLDILDSLLLTAPVAWLCWDMLA